MLSLGSLLGQKSDENFDKKVNIGLYMGYQYTLFDYKIPGIQLDITRDLNFLEIGLNAGFRHRAFDQFGFVRPWEAKESNIEEETWAIWNSADGAIDAPFRDSRFFQTHVHILFRKEFFKEKTFGFDVSLAPGMEYLDVVNPHSLKTTFSRDPNITYTKVQYFISYKRSFSFGGQARVNLIYRRKILNWKLGVEYATYLEGGYNFGLNFGVELPLILR